MSYKQNDLAKTIIITSIKKKKQNTKYEIDNIINKKTHRHTQTNKHPYKLILTFKSFKRITVRNEWMWMNECEWL